MSLSASLSNALSGLNAASRGTQVVASNISNALTEGYGRRALEVSAVSTYGTGGGVQIDGVRRDTNLALISDRRLAQADSGQAQTRAGALSQIEAAFGTPDGADSISGRLAALESALVSASSRPDSTARLNDVLGAAKAVAGTIQAASDGIQTLRMDADTAIANDVATLNETLARIADLNVEIRSHANTPVDISGLFDQRQVLVDRLAEIVPLRQVPRDHGMIALYAQNGATLLDGLPSEFGFDPKAIIVPQMTVEGGGLSGLTLNGDPVSVTGPHALMGGGRLGALFEQRDILAPEAQADLDALARDLIERFQTPGLDPSLASGAAGLFTDGGAVLVPADELGLAARISVNADVDPAQGGEVRRLRDGLGTATAGEVGNATLLNAFADILVLRRAPVTGSLAGLAVSATDLASQTVSNFSTRAQRAVEDEGFSTARTNALREAELQLGVDTDAELQDLMRYEQAYAANAKVIQTVDQLMKLLMEL